MNKTFLTAGALFSGMAVALGAFGAHALRETLSEDQLRIFHTGVEYQFYHALALLAAGILYLNLPSRLIRISAWLFIAGIILFSGSLYLLSMYNSFEWLGPVTPLGGLCFLGGWALILVAIIQYKRIQTTTR